MLVANLSRTVKLKAALLQWATRPFADALLADYQPTCMECSAQHGAVAWGGYALPKAQIEATAAEIRADEAAAAAPTPPSV